MFRTHSTSPGRLRAGSSILRTTAVFDTYWRFAARRQAIFMMRVLGSPPPWTDDPVLESYRFTNVYRASDRVTQYLIRHVLYEGPQTGDEILFRALLFKFFNRIETWQHFASVFGTPSWKAFDYDRYAQALDSILSRGKPIYSGAYIVPSPAFGNARKHRNHLRLLEHIIMQGTADKLLRASSLMAVFRLLRSFPSLGDFLAFQFAIDLNYSELLHFSEMDFVVAGPGARDGIRKCFLDTDGLSDDEVIRFMADAAEDEFRSHALSFQTLWGRRLQLIDCQNLFCEVGKYARLTHPEIKGDSGRTRIKQKFSQNPAPIPQWYPPKWGLRVESETSGVGQLQSKIVFTHEEKP